MAGSVVCGCVLVRTLYNERMAVMRSVKERVSCFLLVRPMYAGSGCV